MENDLDQPVERQGAAIGQGHEGRGAPTAAGE